jgi:cellulose synthase/poly-beta-1,6-N-acetylglucosamine synthase-like glycosyltransferase
VAREIRASSSYVRIAERLALPFVETVRLSVGSRADAAAIRRGTFAMSADGRAYIAPDDGDIPSIAGWLAANPKARQRLSVTTPQAIRAALTDIAAPDLLRRAVEGFASRCPDLSARRTMTRRQVAVASIITLLLGAAFVLAPGTAFLAINALAATLFFAVSALRFVAAAGIRRTPAVTARVASGDETLPVYTVLVPLRCEAEVTGDIVRALLRLDWPRDKLDVKLLLEAGDAATIAAARRAVAGTPFEIVIVPLGLPRTKPRALAFALPLARGEFVTVFDAEDRPHPEQLRQAWEVFCRAPPDLGCLQAALLIDNEAEGWLPLLFAVEYAALFDGLLPALAALGMPVPLGGTSNHFRRRALEEIGGWDCYNVTEDADIGIRLARFGFRTGVIELSTREDAPVRISVWSRQRARWFKGWLQTWLVHSRHPVQLCRDVGLAGAIGFTLTSAGMIVSALIYPIYLGTILVELARPMAFWGHGNPLQAAALGIYFFNLMAGYVAMAVLSLRALKKRGRMAVARGIVFLPFYWLLISAAAYRGVAELVWRPHHWAKTPHRRHRGQRSGVVKRPAAVVAARTTAASAGAHG